MWIRTLGCSGGISAGLCTSAMLVDADVLIDAGTGLGDLGLDELDAIRHVFLTHAHLDHIAGMPMLIDANFDVNFETPVTVYAREETIDALKKHLFNDVIWPDLSKIPSIDRAMLQYVVCNPGDAITIGHREFKAIDVSHSVPSLGYTVQSSSGVFAVSGDTKTNDTLWPALNACDDLRVLVVEVSFPNEQEALAMKSGHYCPLTLSRDLERLRHEPDIWITGMKPGLEARIITQVTEAIPNRNVRMLSIGTVIDV